jgi:hypothetical protein
MPIECSINFPTVVSVGRCSHYSLPYLHVLLLCSLISNTLLRPRYVCGNIANLFKLLVDEKDMSEDIRLLQPDALLILNIASYAAGTNPWHSPCDKLFCTRSSVADDVCHAQSCSDGYLEIISLKYFDLGLIRCGRRGHRIAQGR